MTSKYKPADPRRKSTYAEPASGNSTSKQPSVTKKRGRRGAKDADAADDTFEDVIDTSAATRTAKATSSGAAAGKHANGSSRSKKAVVEWHDEDDEDDSSLAQKAKQSKADKATGSKRQKTDTKTAAPPTTALPQPPALPAPAKPSFSATLLSSSPPAPSLFTGDLHTYLASTLRDDIATLKSAYGQPEDATSSSHSSSSSSHSYSYISSALTAATDSFLAALASQLHPNSATSASSTPVKQTARSESLQQSTDPSRLLAFYSALVASLPPRVEAAKQYAASLTAPLTLPSLTLAPADTPHSSSLASLAATSSSTSSPLHPSPSPEPASVSIGQGYSALALHTDTVLIALQQRKRELQSNREWREGVTERINKQATGDALDATGAEDEDETDTSRKNRMVKRIIKG